jgi:transcriptional regulator with XRE-family HTH domain
MNQYDQLGGFLRSRRDRLRPSDVGLPDGLVPRRVPGLRREEVAQLAGVSVAYYTRLEQGQGHEASDGVLEALARVLQLDDDERTHLAVLAGRELASAASPRPEWLRPELRALVESFADVPALVLGRRTDILAWNRVAHALLAGHLPFELPVHPQPRLNWMRLLFLDQPTRALFGDWPGKARDSVADLRRAAGRYPADDQLAVLVDDLNRASPYFAELWRAQPVRVCAHHVRQYDHPAVGELTLRDQLLVVPDDEGQRIIVYSAEPGSASAAALAQLAVAG